MSETAFAATRRAGRSVIVFEASPFWEPELQRQFAGEDIRVRACRAIRDLQDIIAQSHPAAVVTDFGAAPAEILHWLGRTHSEPRFPFTIVIVPDQEASLEWHLRELGAGAVVDEFFGGRRLADLCRHCFHFRKNPLRSGTTWSPPAPANCPD